MKNNLKLITIFLLFAIIGQSSAARTTFLGDPLLRWNDPNDERFKGIDLEAFFSSPENIQKRKELHELRQDYIKRFAKIYNQPGADYVELQKSLTHDLMAWTKQFIKAAKPKELSNTDYAFIAFGSAGRLESGIVTDLEGGLVVSESIKDRPQIGMEFGKSLASALNGLLGHPIFGEKGYRLDEQANAPAHFAPFVDTKKSMGEILCPMINAYALTKTSAERTFWGDYYYPFEGSHVLTASPLDFAEYMRASQYNIPHLFQLRVNSSTRTSAWYQWGSQFFEKGTYTDNGHLKEQIKTSSCGQNLDDASLSAWANYFEDINQTNELKVVSAFLNLGLNHYLVAGNPKIYQDFVKEQRRILDEDQSALRNKIGKALINESITKWSSRRFAGEIFVLGKLPNSGVFDIKRHPYRFVAVFLSGMALLHHLEEQNQADIVIALFKKGIFGEEFASSLISAINHLTKLRWLSQIKVQGQLEFSMDFFTTKAYETKLNELSKSRLNLEAQLKNLAPESIAYLMTKTKLVEATQDLALMTKLKPLEKDSVINPTELSYLENVLIPVLHRLTKRIAAYQGNPAKALDYPANPQAFQDDFSVEDVNLANYGVTLK